MSCSAGLFSFCSGTLNPCQFEAILLSHEGRLTANHFPNSKMRKTPRLKSLFLAGTFLLHSFSYSHAVTSVCAPLITIPVGGSRNGIDRQGLVWCHDDRRCDISWRKELFWLLLCRQVVNCRATRSRVRRCVPHPPILTVLRVGQSQHYRTCFCRQWLTRGRWQHALKPSRLRSGSQPGQY